MSCYVRGGPRLRLASHVISSLILSFGAPCVLTSMSSEPVCVCTLKIAVNPNRAVSAHSVFAYLRICAYILYLCVCILVQYYITPRRRVQGAARYCAALYGPPRKDQGRHVFSLPHLRELFRTHQFVQLQRCSAVLDPWNWAYPKID